MSDQKLHAEPRTALGRRVKRLRRQGTLPAVVYGRGIDARPIAVAANAFMRVHRMAGESTLIDLDIAGSPSLRVLIQDTAHDPIRGTVTHVDFRAVSMTEKITTRIPLQFSGIAPAAASGVGVLVKHLDHLEVEALPDALVHEIVIDLAPLTTVDSSIHVRDIIPPPGITIRTRGDDVVAAITELAEEEEVAAAPESVDAVKVVGKEEKAAAEAEEGAAKQGEKKEKKK